MNRRSLGTFFIRLFVIMLFGGIVGGLGAVFSVGAKDAVKLFLTYIKSAISDYAILISVIIELFTFILALIILIKSRREYADWDKEDADYIAKTQNNMSIGTAIISVGVIFSLTFFSINNIKLTDHIPKSTTTADGYYYVYFTIFIVMAVGIILLERAFVHLGQDINPEKQGEPLELNFNKHWLKSCDEFEQQVAYKAAYNAYRVSNTLSIGLLCFFMLLNLFYPIGMGPILLTGFFAMVQTLIYTVSNIKYSYHRKGNL